jgi:hypothetical protein
MNAHEKLCRAKEKRIVMLAGWISGKLANGSDEITFSGVKEILDSAALLSKLILDPNTEITVTNELVIDNSQ